MELNSEGKKNRTGKKSIETCRFTFCKLTTKIGSDDVGTDKKCLKFNF